MYDGLQIIKLGFVKSLFEFHFLISPPNNQDEEKIDNNMYHRK